VVKDWIGSLRTRIRLILLRFDPIVGDFRFFLAIEHERSYFMGRNERRVLLGRPEESRDLLTGLFPPNDLPVQPTAWSDLRRTFLMVSDSGLITPPLSIFPETAKFLTTVGFHAHANPRLAILVSSAYREVRNGLGIRENIFQTRPPSGHSDQVHGTSPGTHEMRRNPPDLIRRMVHHLQSPKWIRQTFPWHWFGPDCINAIMDLRIHAMINGFFLESVSQVR
jgi:hypothetical protein